MSQPVVFFDFYRNYPDPGRRSWNWMPWKVRFVLNYKRIPYKTQWLEYPEVEGVYVKYGIAATSTRPDGSHKHTLPLIYDPNTQIAVSDSVEIAKYLDKTYPSTPSIFPEGSAALQVAFIDSVLANVGSAFGKLVDFRLLGLNPESYGYFEARYPALLSMSDEERHKQTPAQLQALENGLGKVKDWLVANGPGKDNLVMGDKACLADFQLAAILVSIRNIAGEESEWWKKICEWHDGKWKRYLDQFPAAVDE